MFSARKSALRGALLAAAVASSVALSPAAVASASDEVFNNARLVIRGGDATALAVCINFAEQWAKKSDKEKQRHEKRRVAQANECDNFADALGGDVELTEVDITIDQDSDGRGDESTNNASLTIRGGDAVAVAACLNVLYGSGSAEQENECENNAIATGGNVELTDVDITIEQG